MARRSLLIALLLLGLATARADEDGREHGVDAELGLQLAAPRGWIFERAGGAGERLRMVRRDGRGWCSLLVRQAGPGATAAERIRAALAPDLPLDARTAELGGRVEVEGTRRGDLVRRLLRVHLVAWLDGDRVLVLRSGSLAEGEDVAQLRSDVDLARRSVESCPDELARPRCVLDRVRRLALVPERTDEVRRDGGSVPLALHGMDGGRIEVRTSDPGEELVTALARALELDERTVARVASSDGALLRARLDRARGVAFATSQANVVAVARAGDVSALGRIARALVVADPRRMDELAARASEAARHLALARDARAELRHADAVAHLGSALAHFPEDAGALELRAALLRDEGDRAVDAIEAAWQAFGAPWVAEVKAKLYLEDALAAEGAGKVALASFRFAHALEFDEAPETIARAERFFASRDAQEHAWQALPGLLRVRELVPRSAALRKAEAELRLRVGEQCVEEGRYQRAREEARRSAKLGGDARRIEAVDKRAQLGERGKLKKPTRPASEPVEDPEKPRRRDRREIAPVTGLRPLSS